MQRVVSRDQTGKKYEYIKKYTVNSQNRIKLMHVAMRFVFDYYKQKEQGNQAGLALSDVEQTLDSLVVMSKFLFEATSKLIDIEMNKQQLGSTNNSNNNNNSNHLSDMIKRIYS